MKYVPSIRHNLENFRCRMRQYAKDVAKNSQGKEKPLVMRYATIAGKEMQSADDIVWFPCTKGHTNTSPQKEDLSRILTNTPIEVIEEGLDHPSYYGPYIKGE